MTKIIFVMFLTQSLHFFKFVPDLIHPVVVDGCDLISNLSFLSLILSKSVAVLCVDRRLCCCVDYVDRRLCCCVDSGLCCCVGCVDRGLCCCVDCVDRRLCCCVGCVECGPCCCVDCVVDCGLKL